MEGAKTAGRAPGLPSCLRTDAASPLVKPTFVQDSSRPMRLQPTTHCCQTPRYQPVTIAVNCRMDTESHGSRLFPVRFLSKNLSLFTTSSVGPSFCDKIALSCTQTSENSKRIHKVFKVLRSLCCVSSWGSLREYPYNRVLGHWPTARSSHTQETQRSAIDRDGCTRGGCSDCVRRRAARIPPRRDSRRGGREGRARQTRR